MPGSAKSKARVILPITDPYVVHHGALGSFALVYLGGAERSGWRPAHRGASRDRDGADARGSRRAVRAAARPHRRPGGRVGDRHGHRHQPRDRHDLSGLDVPLRSHGGTSEQKVPLLVNRRIGRPPENRRWRNFDAFDLGLNLAARSPCRIPRCPPAPYPPPRARRFASRCASRARKYPPSGSSRSAIPIAARWSARCPRPRVEDVKRALHDRARLPLHAHAPRALPDPHEGGRHRRRRGATILRGSSRSSRACA